MNEYWVERVTVPALERLAAACGTQVEKMGTAAQPRFRVVSREPVQAHGLAHVRIGGMSGMRLREEPRFPGEGQLTMREQWRSHTQPDAADE